MIKFLKGEDKHVKFRVHSAKGEDMIVESALYRFARYGDEEASGKCEILNDGQQTILDMKQYPREIGMYELEITYIVADETLKHREEVQVI